MGARHFKQMFEDAFEADRLAIVKAMMLQTPLKQEHDSELGPWWQDTPPDRLMDLGRKLVQMDAEFSEGLKLKLLRGDIRIFMMDREGKPHNIRDPDVIDFDDPIPSDELFFELFEALLTDELGSPGQN